MHFEITNVSVSFESNSCIWSEEATRSAWLPGPALQPGVIPGRWFPTSKSHILLFCCEQVSIPEVCAVLAQSQHPEHQMAVWFGATGLHLHQLTGCGFSSACSSCSFYLWDVSCLEPLYPQEVFLPVSAYPCTYWPKDTGLKMVRQRSDAYFRKSFGDVFS